MQMAKAIESCGRVCTNTNRYRVPRERGAWYTRPGRQRDTIFPRAIYYREFITERFISTENRKEIKSGTTFSSRWPIFSSLSLSFLVAVSTRPRGLVAESMPPSGHRVFPTRVSETRAHGKRTRGLTEAINPSLRSSYLRDSSPSAKSPLIYDRGLIRCPPPRHLFRAVSISNCIFLSR